MRIAHISDLHMRHHLPGTSEIALRRSREMPERFAEAIERISAEQPDLLVVSGDLLDYPLDDMDDPLTMAQGEADLRLLAEILARISCSMALVPGNHDHPVLMQRVFGHLPADQVVAGHRVFTFDDNEGADHVPERVGRSHRRFVDALHSDDGLPQIHVQHYVVWPPLNEEYPHTYGEGAEMRDQIVESGRVRLVIHGHYHWGVPLYAVGVTYFAGIRAFTEAPHPFGIYEIEGENVSFREMRLGE